MQSQGEHLPLHLVLDGLLLSAEVVDRLLCVLGPQLEECRTELPAPHHGISHSQAHVHRRIRPVLQIQISGLILVLGLMVVAVVVVGWWW